MKETYAKHPKLFFALQLVGFLLFSIFAPCAYIIWKFELFQVKSVTQVGLWGIICFIICASVGAVMIKYYLAGMKHKYSFTKKFVSLFVKVILPLFIAIVVLKWLENNIRMVVNFLIVLLPCELIAGLINPFPRWCFENEIEGVADTIDFVLGSRESKDKKDTK